MNSPTKPRPSRTELFLAKVNTTGDCWEWTGSTTDRGYGQFNNGTTMVKAHRWMYELAIGPIPAGLDLDHLCRNTSCVRPSHLEPVTHRENVLRGTGPTATNAAKTHCPNGHPLGDEADNSGRRYCRICHRGNAREFMREKRGTDGEQGPCPVCGIAYRLRANGTLWRHSGMTPAGFSTGATCPGAGEPPRAAA